jgi:hypothetical protein
LDEQERREREERVLKHKQALKAGLEAEKQ